MIIAIIVLAVSALFMIVLLTAGWVFGTYNLFVSNREDIRTMWSNIKTEYQRRADLFYNLVEATKSHKKFEKSTLVEVTKARAGAFGSTVPQEMKKLNGLDNLFSKLAVVFENYPTLKSNEQHNKLMEEISVTENRINESRTAYNSEVREYNVLVQTIPRNIIANMFGFTKELFFENEESTNTAPKINLD